MAAEPILIVDDDPFVLGLLMHVGETRGLTVVGVRTPEEADAAMTSRAFGVVVVDLRLGAASGLDLVKQIRLRDASVETIVISADRRLSSALESFEQDIFAFLPKPLDPAHVFATAERALERRRGVIERRRLTWELALLNEVAEIVASSLDIDAVLQRALNRVARAFGCQRARVRLTPITGGEVVVEAASGIDVGRREPVPDAEFQSVLSAPIVAGDLQLGVISLASMAVDAFTEAHQHIVVTIGRQFGVAVANAQLYQRVHRAKVEWERTFDAISDPIAVFDESGRVMRTNTAMAMLCGWRITEVPGRPCADTGLCGHGAAGCLVSLALADGQAHVAEVVTSAQRVFAVTTLPVPGARAVVLFAKEVTEERQQAARLREIGSELTSTNAELTVTVGRLRNTQSQLVQSEKLSALGQLVAGVAHELNNPLTSVIGYAELVRDAISQHVEPVTAAGMLDDVGRILSESDRAARIVRNLLMFARRQSTERARADIAEVCRRVLALRTYTHRLRAIHVDLALPVGLPPVYIDDGQMQQALLNLVLNAEHALVGIAGARLTVAATAEPESSSVRIAISDNGHGISVDDLPRVFDPFFTTREVGEGTGLGLSIAYGIVRDHGGQIWTESVDGATTFAVRLPARFGEVAGQKRAAAIVAHADGETRDFVMAVLAGWGYSVRAAANVREAMEQVAGGDADLLFLDPSLVAPDVTRWQRVWAEVTPRLKMVAVDAPVVDDEAAKFLRASAACVLSPPFDLPHIWSATLAAPRRDNLI